MSTSRALALAFLIASLPACKGADSEQKAAPSAAAPTPAAPADPQKPETSAAESADAAGEGGTDTGTETGEEEEEQAPLPASFDEVGVELCDAYVKDFVGCIDSKVPEAEREALRRQVFVNIAAWKQTAAGGESAKQGLQTGCRIAREQAKRATQDWACDW